MDSAFDSSSIGITIPSLHIPNTSPSSEWLTASSYAQSHPPDMTKDCDLKPRQYKKGMHNSTCCNIL